MASNMSEKQEDESGGVMEVMRESEDVLSYCKKKEA